MARNTITWNRYITRPATEEEAEEYGVSVGEKIDIEEPVELPAKFEVCGRCEGEGTHTNPSIDGNGITSSEWDEWGEEEKEMYLTGGYDVTCHECGGKRVVSVVDEEACDKKLFKEYEEAMEEKAREDYADARMRYWESGGYDY